MYTSTRDHYNIVCGNMSSVFEKRVWENNKYLRHNRGGMGFEKFQGKGQGSVGRTNQEPRISLRASQSIGLNYAAIQEYFEDYNWVELLYDPVNRKVGINRVEEQTQDAYKVRKSNKDGHGGNINCTAFIKEYNLTPEQTTHYEAEWDDEHNIVIADLDDPVLKYESSE